MPWPHSFEPRLSIPTTCASITGHRAVTKDLPVCPLFSPIVCVSFPLHPGVGGRRQDSSEAVARCTPEGLSPRADSSSGPASPASRWSTTAQSARTRRSSGRWPPAERCPGRFPRCPCSTCARVSGYRPRWTAPRCPSSWTSAEGTPRCVWPRSAGLISGNKASVSRLGQRVGRARARGGAHRPARSSGHRWWGCSAGPGLCPPMPNPRGQRSGVARRAEDQGLTAPHPFPLRFPVQTRRHPPFSPNAQSSWPTATSFLLIPAPGLTAPRLGMSRETAAGR